MELPLVILFWVAVTLGAAWLVIIFCALVSAKRADKVMEREAEFNKDALVCKTCQARPFGDVMHELSRYKDAKATTPA
jgi:hypothetical protein